MQTPPDANQRVLDRQGTGTHPSRQASHEQHPNTRTDGPAEKEAGCGWSVVLFVVRAMLAVVWTVAYGALVKPVCRATKFAFLVLAILGFFAAMAAWVIDVSVGGLHALHVWACDDVLPNRLFFVDWCAGTNAAPPPLSAPPFSSAWTPLTTAEWSLLQRPDRHFCVFDFGNLLAGMADEQWRYMTDGQRERFAVMHRAGSVVGRLQDVGRKQARTVQRAQEKMMGLIDDQAAPLPERQRRRQPPPPPPPVWFSAVWLWSLFAGTRPPSPPPPVSVALEGLVREISRVLEGEVASRKQLMKDVKALHKEMDDAANSVCGWNTALKESISDKTHRLEEARLKARPRRWWQRKALPVDRGAGQVWLWEEQAKIIRNEIVMWRRRKAKANLLCRMLDEGMKRTAKLLKAGKEEVPHLAEMAQVASDLVAEVSSQGGQASDSVLQGWGKTARDLGISYLHSFRLYYPEC